RTRTSSAITVHTATSRTTRRTPPVTIQGLDNTFSKRIPDSESRNT
ncbi:Uncharacterized protein BM_BM14445, partial [Brugia malayi]